VFAGKSRRRGFGLRAAVVLAATGALVFGGAAAASAKGHDAKSGATTLSDSSLPPGGAKIGYRGDRVGVTTSKGKAAVVEITLQFSAGRPKLAYCIDYTHTAGSKGSQYDAGKWDGANVKNLDKIQWILTNSFPNKDAASVLKDAKVSDTSGLSSPELDAYVGTQTAIWNYSDGVELTSIDDLSPADRAAATAVHDYLLKNAQGAKEPAAPAVSITPQQATGHVGGNAGPFTVHATSVKDVVLAADNGQIVDADGKPVTSTLHDGDQFWVKTDSAGSVTVTANGSGVLPTGSVFIMKGDNAKIHHQKLILANTASKKVVAKATVTVTAQQSASPSASPSSPAASPSKSTAAPASPSASGTAGGGLPVTGTSLPIIIGVALVLLVGGGGAVFLARRRRMTH
jgi:TQXA domain-containing protein